MEVIKVRKGQIKRLWIPEQKLEIVHKHLDEHISVRTLEKEYTADRSMICRRVKEYIAEREDAFIPKGHPVNQFAALYVSKSGYYRWRGRQGKPNRYERDRQHLRSYWQNS